MKKKTIFITVLVIALLLICCTALAAEGQVNPRRKHVEETIKQQNLRQGSYLSGSPFITITCNRAPALGTPGKFTVTVNNDDGSNWLYGYAISDYERDPGGYVYFGSETNSRIFEGFDFYTSGNYRLFVFLYRSGNLDSFVAWDSYSFTVDAKAGYPTLEEKAQSIVNECRVAGDDWQTALNLHDWLTKHVYYDLNFECYGADVLLRGKGVCDSYSKAFKLLCNTAGISSERVISRKQNHAWNVIKFGDIWYQVDVTWDDPAGGTEAVSGHENYDYFCLSDDLMFLDHTHSDVTYDPGCPSLAMNYYIKTNTWQTFGKYSYSGDTVMDYFLDQINQGYTVSQFPLNDWEFYWPGGNIGYGMKPANYGIYAYGMECATWTLENGGGLKVDVDLEYQDHTISIRVTGWDIPETGTLTLPASIKTIDANAFEGIKSTTVVIPSGCTKINAGAFKNSGVRRMYIPGTLTTVAEDAFDGCGRIIFILDANNNDFAEFARRKEHMVVEP